MSVQDFYRDCRLELKQDGTKQLLRWCIQIWTCSRNFLELETESFSKILHVTLFLNKWLKRLFGVFKKSLFKIILTAFVNSPLSYTITPN